MHGLIRENLEGYLSGALGASEREKLEAHLAECGVCRREFDEMAESARCVQRLRPPADLDADLRPGFYARVMERVERQREIPFWAMLVDPVFGRRFVFACLMLLALLGAYVAAFEPPASHRPEAMFAGQRPVPVPAPRLGPDLDHNRGVVLATLVEAD